MDSVKPYVLLSSDISAAFDMLDRGHFLHRAIELFEISDQVINWLELFSLAIVILPLQNRSSASSVFGPLLFSIFTSPVSRLITKFNVSCNQYADDTHCIHLSACYVLTILTTCQSVLMLSPDSTSNIICCSTRRKQKR